MSDMTAEKSERATTAATSERGSAPSISVAGANNDRDPVTEDWNSTRTGLSLTATIFTIFDIFITPTMGALPIVLWFGGATTQYLQSDSDGVHYFRDCLIVEKFFTILQGCLQLYVAGCFCQCCSCIKPRPYVEHPVKLRVCFGLAVALMVWWISLVKSGFEIGAQPPLPDIRIQLTIIQVVHLLLRATTLRYLYQAIQEAESGIMVADVNGSPVVEGGPSGAGVSTTPTDTSAFGPGTTADKTNYGTVTTSLV
ncbi:unnamed protein product [Amoebophrya sp. A25]|nr:unnamed protein product [Amoebophrya sp. A25]|eukprot:GSA25T00020196001.1